MAKKENINGSGEISMIRDILIGPQFKDYENQLQKLHAQVKHNEKENKEKLKQLEGQMTTKIEQMEGQMTAKIEQLEGQMTAKIEQMEGQMTTKLEQLKEEAMGRYTNLEQLLLNNTQSSKTSLEQSIQQERRDIGKLFADISNQLLNK